MRWFVRAADGREISKFQRVMARSRPGVVKDIGLGIVVVELDSGGAFYFWPEEISHFGLDH